MQADIAVRSDGRIAGRIVDARGTPQAGLTVDLLQRNTWNRSLQRAADPVTTRSDGSYEFTRVAPGTYAIGVDTLRTDAAGRQRSQIYLPGVPQAEDARAILLGASQHIVAEDLVLPDAVRTVTLTGTVREADWRPVPGARVRVRSEVRPFFWTSAPVIADREGRFQITAMAGHRYSLHAESPEGPPSRRGEMGPFDVTSDWTGLDIVLEPDSHP